MVILGYISNIIDGGATKGREATPSGWEPGKKTLKPSPQLVGNVWKEWSVSESK